MLRFIKVKDMYKREVRINVNHIVDYYEMDNGTNIKLINDCLWTWYKPEEIDDMLLEVNQRETDNMTYIIHQLKGD